MLGTVLVLRGGFGDCGRNAVPLQPHVGGSVFSVRERVEEMAVQFGDALVIEASHHRQEAGLVRRNLQVGNAE